MIYDVQWVLCTGPAELLLGAQNAVAVSPLLCIITLKFRFYHTERAGIYHGMPTLAFMMPALWRV